MNTRKIVPLLAAFSFLLGACGDSPTGPDPDPDPPEPVDPPSVELSVGLNLDNSSRSDTLTVAEGESVILEWSTTNNPASCTASGGWSGSKSTSGDEEVSSPLTSVGSTSFTLECENSGGSDRASVDVEVRDDENFHVRSDRVDDVDGDYIHFFYIISSDGEDRALDLNGKIATSISATQTWMANETGGLSLSVDTYEGELDITFLRLEETRSEMMSKDAGEVRGTVIQALKDAGLIGESKEPAVYYDGELSDEKVNRCGIGNIFFPRHCPPIWAESPSDDRPGTAGFTMLHEIFHGLGVVSEEAPNYNSGHVNDHPRDLMYRAGPDDPPGRPTRHIDYNNDDYFDPSGNLPEDIVNVAESRFIKQ